MRLLRLHYKLKPLQAWFAVGALAAGLAATASSAAAEPPAVSAKRAEAQAVLGQIRDLDSQVERTVEAYNYATIKLAGIRRELKANTYDLHVARSNLRRAQQFLGRRLYDLYVNGESDSPLEVILGARGLSDLIERVDAVNRVADEDVRVLSEVKTFRARVERRQRALVRARGQQRQLVARLAAERALIERQLAERQRLLSSIKSEIVRLQAEERARQERLRREAEARLAARRAAARAAAQRAAATPGQQQVPDLGLAVSTPEGVTLAPPSRYGGVVAIAMQYLGVPYVWGGASPSGFDCSGFIMYVYAKVGVSLPHYAAAQYNYGVPVSREQLQSGDLVFFDGLGHDGIYIGGGQFIHAPHTGDVVKISSLSESWYTANWVGARRIL